MIPGGCVQKPRRENSFPEWNIPAEAFADVISDEELKKSRPDLFPPKALLLAGDVLAFGDTKHPDMKWKRMSVEDHLGAAYRHVLRWQSGEALDSETSKSHLVHALVRLAMAVEQETAK